jgi:predicted Na+-dependent transporter
MAALAWIGARAHWALAVGIALCFVAPDVSHALRPALPYLVPVVLGLAMARVDLGATARAALRPWAALGLVAGSLLRMPVSGGLYLGAARRAGLDPAMAAALVYLAAAPPIASAANLCFILGYDARRALQVTVAATLLAPALGPLTVALFLPGTPALSAGTMALKLAAMIGGGVVLALALRRAVGPERIAREARTFDGVAVLALVIFVLPLFDGVPAMIAADPRRALVTLAIATVANLGVNLAARRLALGAAPAEAAGAYGVLFGNRTIAIYLAALPFEPTLALFVALYRAPMLLTPLALRRQSVRTRN